MPEFQLIAEKAVNILWNRSSRPARQERKRADKDK
jgi:hypothetical protein